MAVLLQTLSARLGIVTGKSILCSKQGVSMRIFFGGFHKGQTKKKPLKIKGFFL
jgi:hypothetical protein